MKRKQLIKELERLDTILLEDCPTEELTDYAREHTHYAIGGAIDYLTENYDPDEEE